MKTAINEKLRGMPLVAMPTELYLFPTLLYNLKTEFGFIFCVCNNQTFEATAEKKSCLD